MSNIDVLRDKLNKAIENEDVQDILQISQELDIEILNFIRAELEQKSRVVCV